MAVCFSIRISSWYPNCYSFNIIIFRLNTDIATLLNSQECYNIALTKWNEVTSLRILVLKLTSLINNLIFDITEVHLMLLEHVD